MAHYRCDMVVCMRKVVAVLRSWYVRRCLNRFWLYATYTFPIMHLVCPFPPPPPSPNFAWALFSISLGTAIKPRRNEKQRLCKILRGCFMGIVEVAYDVVGVWEASGTKLVPRVEPWGRGCQRHIPRKIKPREHPKAQTSKAHPVWR